MSELISVIVPIYNVEKYLERCVNSIRQQTYSDIEIILVNDGSIDSCADIIKQLEESDSRIRSFYQKNGGLSAARNTGIEHANGSYLVFVDSDDYISPKMIEILYNNLIQNHADVSVCDFYWIYDGEKVPDFTENNIQVYEGIEVLHRLIGDDVISVVAWNKMYKAKIFDTLRYPVGRLHEDEYILHEVFSKCHRTVYTSAKLYYYLKRQGSISVNLSAQNYIDKEEAFCRRLEWSVQNADKQFSDWCFNAMINMGNYVLKQKELEKYDEVISLIKERIRSALQSVSISNRITWRKLVIGYIWLWNPEYANRFRGYLHC